MALLLALALLPLLSASDTEQACLRPRAVSSPFFLQVAKDQPKRGPVVEEPTPAPTPAPPPPPWPTFAEWLAAFARCASFWLLLAAGGPLVTVARRALPAVSAPAQAKPAPVPCAAGEVAAPVIACEPRKGTLLELLGKAGDADAAALHGVDRLAFTHGDVRAVLSACAMWDGLAAAAGGKVLAVAMEPGPELALALLAVMARGRCAPLNPSYTKEEAALAMRQLEAGALVARGAGAVVGAAEEMGLPVWQFEGMGRAAALVPVPKAAPVRMSGEEDVALLLRTSGTTGKSKVVPIALGQHVQGSRLIAECCKLTREDVCLNVLPLFHVGGISCNLMGSLVSGGSVVCMGSFSPVDFLKRLPLEPKPTWYYASPSIHEACLNAASSLGGLPALRLVRNAAAALPVALQERLARQWHPAVIMPTYGMTECMPIASPLLNQQAAPLGSVGRLVGPRARIVAGELQVRGDVVMRGYVGDESGLDENGWFKTGDLCEFDESGHLFVRGRCKEAINRGGETISPQDVEEAVSSAASIAAALAFPVPDDRLGEAVGLAVVLDVKQATDAEVLQAVFGAVSRLSPSSRPALVARIEVIPRTSTGKVSRLAVQKELLASRLATEAKEAMAAHGGRVLVDLREGRVVKSPVADLVGNGGEEAMEIMDSLGQVREANPVAVLARRVGRDMCFLGMAAICLNHWRDWSPCFCSKFNPETWQCIGQHPAFKLLSFLYGGQWHMMAFFQSLGWQDGLQKNDSFTSREPILLCVAVGLKLLGIASPTLAKHTWSTLDHPARWFIASYLVSRCYVRLGQRARLSPTTLSILIAPLNALALSVLVLVMKQENMASYLLGFTGLDLVAKAASLTKVYSGPVVYVLSFYWLPSLFSYVVKRGAASQRREMAHGVGLALLFSAVMCLPYAGLRVGALDATLLKLQVPVLEYVRFPIGLPLMLLELSVLTLLLTYLPLSTIPTFAKDARLAVLLLMPMAMLSEVTCSMKTVMDRHPYSMVWNLAVVLAALACYICLVAPLLQLVLLKVLSLPFTFRARMAA